MRAAKLVDGIKLKQNDKKYNLAEVIFDLDMFDALYYSDLEETPAESLIEVRLILTLEQTSVRDTDILDKLYTSYMENKSTQIVRHNKSMTIIINKLKEIHAKHLSP